MNKLIKILASTAWAALFFAASASPQELGEITFATDWKAQAEHGGFYQAVAKGFYEKRGLKVKIRPGGPGSDNPRLIAAGALDIAMASNSFQPVNLIASGADVKVVMTSFQKDPQVLMVHPHVQASSIADLKGMPVFISDAARAAFWPWLEARFGFEPRQVRKYNYSLAPWLVNKDTVQEGYLSSEPFTASKEGVTPKVFLFADAGYPGYAGMVMVRGEYLRGNRSAVQAFVDASIEGWTDYLWGDPQAGNALILQDNPEMTEELLAFAIQSMKSNKMIGDKGSVGRMTSERWKAFYEEMSALNAVTSDVDVEKAFTLEFVNGSAGN
ncbi:MAG: ABC transporter substrate-binding protein [Kordiimonadaceae bacterium]|nr:ABC transporter substrate-binding protein [Kordiimonadaceae bacterium]MBO6570202.1 ABC transporter substrate-binding protein [Kordiimonadaceae bacterium]MBO6965700.1 ABC transporter substrate-binding protein [Kordiimonadaceae bacterium]